MIIALDGHSSCGKSTIAKALAEHLGFTYVDTGAMYRAVTLFCQQNKIIVNGIINEDLLKQRLNEISISFKKNIQNMQDTYLNGINVEKEIRSMEVAQDVSMISQIGFVRKFLLTKQQDYGKNSNVVMDGRDIGTAVFPNADYKFFITASPEIRAERRYKELTEKHEHITYEEVFENIKQRDLIDSTRKESPLKQAEDAILVDTSNMNRKEQLEWILNKINL